MLALLVILSLGWTVVYFGLLLIAIVTDSGAGSPVAYPLGLAFFITLAAIAGFGIFIPACGIGAIVCRLTRWHWLAGIPFVLGAAFGLSYFLYWLYIINITTHSMLPALIVLKNFLIFISVPLGAYWWVTKGLAGAMKTLAEFVIRKFVRTS